MAKKRKKATEEQIRALNGGDEAYERHERLLRDLTELSEKLRLRAEARRREAEQAS